MKHSFLYVLFLAVAFTGALQAQTQVDLAYYQPDPTTIMTLGMPVGSMALTRFETTAPAKILSLSFQPVTKTTAGDSVVVYLFDRQGGGAFPYLLNFFFATKLYVPANVVDQQVQLDLSSFNLGFSTPTNFFMGVQILGDNVTMRMDLITQSPPCGTAEGDTMYTSSLWQNLGAGYIPFTAHLTGGVALNNWYMSVKVEYDNNTPATMFSDVTQSAGLGGIPGSKKPMRVAVADFNNDGWQDVLWGDKLFKNNGNGTFTNVATAAGYTGGSTVNMFADVNNDGYLDIVCQPDNLIYLSNKNGTFTKETTTGFGKSVATQAMAFADIDGDKYPDLFVANGEYQYVKNPQDPTDSAIVKGAAWEGFLYANLQDGTFRDVKSSNFMGYNKGLYGVNPYNNQLKVNGYRPATCVEWIDIDNDGDPDLFIGNDRLQPNYLFANQGDGTFRESASLYNLAGNKNKPVQGYYGDTRGCDFGDYNNDGNFDLATSENEEPYNLLESDYSAVWKNGGKSAYQYSLIDSSVTKLPFNIYSGDVSWGDFNNDGLLDVAFTSGPNCAKTRLFMQNPNGSFTDVSYAAGIQAENTLGLAWFDFDNDGALDLLVVSETGLKLYKNQVPGNGNWVGFNLIGKTCNDFAIGARLTVTAGGKSYLRYVNAGKGAGSQQPYVQFVGIAGATKVDQVIIKWPGGNSDTLSNLAINKIYTDSEYVKPTVGIDDVKGPDKLTLQQNYPNPFSRSASPTTQFVYNLPASTNVTIEIFDMNGARVRTLVSKMQAAGIHYEQWDGRNDNSQLVTTGTYQYVLSADGITTTKRMIVLK